MHFFHRLTAHSSVGLLLLRLSIAAIFLFHGIQKWSMWGLAPSEQMSANMLNLMKCLSIVEPLGGLALLFGFLTQLAAGGLALIMLGAIYFKQYVWMLGFVGKNGMVGWEFDLVLLAGCLALFFLGAGKYSLDHTVTKK